MERRAATKGNADQQSTTRTPSRTSVTQALERIRRTARERKKERFTALLHHIDPDLLEAEFFALKKHAAPGTDGVTWRDYEQDLKANLEDLHARVHRGAYRPQPSRRVYIPKPDGRQRPLAIAALEDKIVQRATAVVLNAIYEEDFLGFSYGFRPGRSAHDAMDALAVGIEHRKVNFIVDADIRSFFDTVDQQWLTRFVEHRIGDPRIIRLIQKWLKAGVLEEGAVRVGDQGTAQGAVISPLLANVYLHYALDLWAERYRRREATGDMIIVRYADDFIVGFESEDEARHFLEALRERLREFALSLHPEKTRLIEFGRFAVDNRRRREKALSRSRHAVHPQHDRLRILRRIGKPVRPPAGKAKAVPHLQRPCLAVHRQHHLALEHEAGFLAVVGVELVSGGAAGLQVYQEQIEPVVGAGRTEQLLGDARAPEFQLVPLHAARHHLIGYAVAARARAEQRSDADAEHVGERCQHAERG
ncbi:group II intron reverse transcriptase/maturase [Bradyrhizobium sp. LM2.7]